MKVLVGICVVLFTITIELGDAAYKKKTDAETDINPVFDEIPQDQLHDSLFPHHKQRSDMMNHEVEYGFKRGHGHENPRGDFVVNSIECPLMCTMDMQPVCGSDGNTYNNKCQLDTAACRARKHIYIAKQGRC